MKSDMINIIQNTKDLNVHPTLKVQVIQNSQRNQTVIWDQKVLGDIEDIEEKEEKEESADIAGAGVQQVQQLAEQEVQDYCFQIVRVQLVQLDSRDQPEEYLLVWYQRVSVRQL